MRRHAARLRSACVLGTSAAADGLMHNHAHAGRPPPDVCGENTGGEQFVTGKDAWRTWRSRGKMAVHAAHRTGIIWGGGTIMEACWPCAQESTPSADGARRFERMRTVSCVTLSRVIRSIGKPSPIGDGTFFVSVSPWIESWPRRVVRQPALLGGQAMTTDPHASRVRYPAPSASQPPGTGASTGVMRHTEKPPQT